VSTAPATIISLLLEVNVSGHWGKAHCGEGSFYREWTLGALWLWVLHGSYSLGEGRKSICKPSGFPLFHFPNYHGSRPLLHRLRMTVLPDFCRPDFSRRVPLSPPWKTTYLPAFRLFPPRSHIYFPFSAWLLQLHRGQWYCMVLTLFFTLSPFSKTKGPRAAQEFTITSLPQPPLQVKHRAISSRLLIGTTC